MSLIFDALKKGHADASASASAPVSGKPSTPSTVVKSQPMMNQAEPHVTSLDAREGQRVSGLVLAGLAGMLIAAGGAWLYLTGKASTLATATTSAPTNLQLAQSAPAPVPARVVVPAFTPLPVPVAAAPVISQTPARIAKSAPAKVTEPIADADTVATAPALAVKPAPTAVAKVALPAAQVTPAPTPAPAVVAPAVRAPVNTQVQLSAVVNPFDVREAFQSFVKLLQMGQLADAQVAADKISTAMGRAHVVSLRAQGYMALKKNDLTVAKGQYLQLIQLLPADREAGLNLALIDWRLGDKDAAAKRVSGLLENFPNDAEIQALNLNVRGQ